MFYLIFIHNVSLRKKLPLNVLKEKKNFVANSGFLSARCPKPFLYVVSSLILCCFRVQCL